MTRATAFPVAVALYLLSGLFFAGLDATTKWLVRDHALFLVLWARFMGQTLVAASYARRQRGPGFWRTERLRLQLVRSAILALTTLLVVTGLLYLPLAEVTAIMLTTPLFVVLLAKPLLGETPTRSRVLAAAAGFAGAAILVRPGSSVFHPAALALFVAAAANAVYAILTRRLKGEPAPTTLFYSGIVAVAVFSLMLPWTIASAPGSAGGWLPLAVLGLLAGAGHGLMIEALRRAPASSLAPLTYAQVVWATLLGWLAFRHLPDTLSFVGMGVIVASGIAFAMRERAGAT
jgi:drug/metabolite transporter (DMT)-like permease